MPSENDEVNDQAGAASVERSRRRRRNSNEQSIKDSVAVIGSIMLFLSFCLLLEANLRDNGWNESSEQRITALCACFGIISIASLFGLYLYFRMRKTCRPAAAEISAGDNNRNVSFYL